MYLQLSAKKWNEAITEMHQENRYKQMVIYVEACESGSMFDKLLSDNINGKTRSMTNTSLGLYL